MKPCPNGEDCGCDNVSEEVATRISGIWKVVRVSEHEKGVRVLFQQESKLICHFCFEKDTIFSEGSKHSLLGWQKPNRFNILLIDGFMFSK